VLASPTEHTFHLAVFLSIATVPWAFGGLIAFGIGHIVGVGGKDEWSWIFMSPQHSPFLKILLVYGVKL